MALGERTTTIGLDEGESMLAICSMRHQPRSAHASSSRCEPSSCVHAPASTKKYAESDT